MKRNFLKSLALSLFTLSALLLFSQCESDVSGNSPEDFTDGFQTMNGPGAPWNTPGGNVATGQGLSSEALCDCLNARFLKEELSAKEAESLVFMREEEKLARDVYLGLYEKWGSLVFANIAKSEQRHMDATLCLLKKYEIADPVGDHANGVFQNSTLQSLYSQLIEQGSASLEAAFRVGATIEDLDIFDLTEALKELDNQDVQAVYGALANGSGNHLRAFVRNLSNLKATYAPQYISRELFDSILSQKTGKSGGVCGASMNGEPCPWSQQNNNGPGAGACGGSGPKGQRRG